METIREMIEKRLLVPKLRWNIPNKDSLTESVERNLHELITRHEQETREHLDKKPPEAADIPLINQWIGQQKEIEDRQRRQMDEFTKLTEGLLSDSESIEKWIASYGSIRETFERQRKKAVEDKVSEIEQIEAAQKSENIERNRIGALAKSCQEKLSVRGVSSSPDDDFFGWKDALKDRLYHEACAHRHLDPSKSLRDLVKPNEPGFIGAERHTYKDPWTGWDIVLLICGFSLGAAVGSAVNAVMYDSDGIHLNVFFWGALGVITGLSFAVGKLFFPTQLSSIYLGTINLYPYSKDENHTGSLAQARKDSVRAAIWIIFVMVIFCCLDYYGWSKAANESNAAQLGDVGATKVNPYIAGSVMAFITVIAMLVKIGSIIENLKKVAHTQRSEVSKRKGEYEIQQRNYNMELLRYENLSKLYAAANTNTVERQASYLPEISAVIGEYKKEKSQFEANLSGSLDEKLSDLVQQIKNQTLQTESKLVKLVEKIETYVVSATQFIE